MAARDFLLPDLGEGLTEGEIVRWLVALGDTVAVDQPVVEIETAKAIVEVPSPFAGVVTALHGAEGDEVQVGAPLLSVDSAAGSVPDEAEAVAGGAGSVPGEAEAAEMVPEPAAAQDDGASGSVLVGYGTTGGAGTRRRRGLHPSTVSSSATRGAQLHTVPSSAGPVAATGRPLAKPPVRKLAKDLGVDLGAVHPTGPRGDITREDVQAAVSVTGAAAEAGDERIPLRGVRKRIAERMTTSRTQIPEATTWVDCDATELMRARDALNASQSAVKLSPLALILRIVVAGLAEYRPLNAAIDGEDIVLHGAVHLGVAAQTERGLVVPVIRDAHRRTLLELGAELNRLAEGARAGTLTPAELSGSTFTVSNFGSFGVDGGNPVINFPEAAILGVGRIADRPWVHDGELAVRKVLQLSIAFDHRIADGGDAAGFLRWVADRVEHPTLLLASL